MGETYDKCAKEIKNVPYSIVKGDNNTPRVDIDGRMYTHKKFLRWSQKMKKRRRIFRSGGK